MNTLSQKIEMVRELNTQAFQAALAAGGAAEYPQLTEVEITHIREEIRRLGDEVEIEAPEVYASVVSDLVSEALLDLRYASNPTSTVCSMRMSQFLRDSHSGQEA